MRIGGQEHWSDHGGLLLSSSAGGAAQKGEGKRECGVGSWKQEEGAFIYANSAVTSGVLGGVTGLPW